MIAIHPRAALAVFLLTGLASAGKPAAPPEGSEASAAAPEKASDDKELSTAQAGMKTEKAEARREAAPTSEEEAKPKPKPEDRESGEEDAYGHGMQFGIRAGVVFGYKIDFRYPHSPLCKDPDFTKPYNKQQKICGFGTAPGTEVAISFAPLDGIEPYLFGRFGFSGESATNTEPLQMFGVGARIYTMSDSRFKMFIEPALAYETEGWAGNRDWNQNMTGLKPAYKKDMIFHVGIGPQYDFAKAFGVFLNAGVDVGVFRSISSVLLANLGIQIRFP